MQGTQHRTGAQGPQRNLNVTSLRNKVFVGAIEIRTEVRPRRLREDVHAQSLHSCPTLFNLAGL